MLTWVAFGILIALIRISAASPPLRRSTSPISTAELSGFAPYTQFARAAYCPTSKLIGWNCGGKQCRVFYLHPNCILCFCAAACNALPGFQPTLVGGDGNAVQICPSRFYLNQGLF